jgi:hypothetical protein
MKKIINCQTGEVSERELNADELEQQAIDEAAQALEQAEAEAKATARAALLTQLGISEEQAKLLLG